MITEIAFIRKMRLQLNLSINFYIFGGVFIDFSILQ